MALTAAKATDSKVLRVLCALARLSSDKQKENSITIDQALELPITRMLFHGSHCAVRRLRCG